MIGDHISTATKPLEKTITYRYDFAWLDWNLSFEDRQARIGEVKRDIVTLTEKILKIDGAAKITDQINDTNSMMLSISSKKEEAVEMFAKEAKSFFAKYRFHYSVL